MVAFLFPAAPTAAAESAVHVIDEPLSGAQVVDIDRDGIRDLVLLAADPHVGLQWWSIRSGALAMAAEVTLFDVPTTFESASFRQVHWQGRPRLLLLLASSVVNTGQPCCTELFWIDAEGGRLVASPIDGTTPDGMESLVALDIDGDGTDELLAFAGVYAEDQEERAVQLLRFDGDSVAPAGSPITVRADSSWSQPGDSDGLPGAEIIFGPDASGVLLRLRAGEDGGLRTETADIPEELVSIGGSWVVGASKGTLLIQTDNELSLVTWPNGGLPSVRSSADGVWAMSGVLQLDEGSTVIPAQSSVGASGLTILDINLKEIGRVAYPVLADNWWTLAERHPGLQQIEPLYPAWGAMGPLGSGGIGWMIEGAMVRIVGSGAPEILIEGGLTGVAPVGSIGPDDGWLVLANRAWGFPEFESLTSTAPASMGGLVIAPLAEVVDPSIEPAIRLSSGAVTIDGDRAAVGDASISFEVEAPVGSRIVALLNGRVESDQRSEQATTRLTMTPRGRRADDAEMEALVMVGTPLGRLTVAEWTVEVMREGPRLEVTDETAAPGLASVVRGTTDRGATVEVDGRAVAVARDGTFSVRVDATPWPRDLRVVATSIVGRESVSVLSVVGLFDWRPIPWQVGMAVLTMAVGVALYVTAGRRRPPPQAALAGDGEWIEFEGPIREVAWDEPVVRSAGGATRERDERVE
jgi:hypothetical protein